MDITNEQSALYPICSGGLDFEIDSSTSQQYQYDSSFDIFSNSVLSEADVSGTIDPIFLQSGETFSNFDEDSVQEFVEGFGEAQECVAPSSFTVPPKLITTQPQQVTHYSDKYPLPNYLSPPPVKGSSVQTQTVYHAEPIENKENQENFANPSIAIHTNDASQTLDTDTNSENSPMSSPSLPKKKQRYGGSRTPYRCGKCGQPKKGHDCTNITGETQRKPSKKRALATSNTPSPASSEPHTPITPIFYDSNIYGTDYRAMIQERNSRTATSTDNAGAMSPLPSLPNSPSPSIFEIPRTKCTPITQSGVITPKTKSLKTAANTTAQTGSPIAFTQTVVLNRKANQ